MKQNTRIAPSPTGYFHIGTARTAYHNWLVAKATGGKFIVRIDDTDINRSNDSYKKIIFDCLNWLGIDYDLTFDQSDRILRYKDAANILINKNLASISDNGAVLFNPKYIPQSWSDTVAGNIKISNMDIKAIDGMVLIKSNGLPTYNFASIVDDLDYNINRIIRGVDHISNTSKQITIACALSDSQYIDIQFTHVGLIHDINGKKISKRDGAKSVTDYQDYGCDPNALLNLMLRLGWTPKLAGFDSLYKKISKDLAISLIINQGNFKNSSSKFDLGKLNFYNKQYGGKKLLI